jgi:hypothetical protein
VAEPPPSTFLGPTLPTAGGPVPGQKLSVSWRAGDSEKQTFVEAWITFNVHGPFLTLYAAMDGSRTAS